MYVCSIIHSGPDSYVFVNMVGHGTTGLLVVESLYGYYYVSV